MQKILQEKLIYLLDKYSVNKRAVITQDIKYVNIDSKDIPLLPWVNERRFIELQNLVKHRFGKISTYRITHIDKTNADLTYLLYREVSIAEFTADSKAKEIFTLNNGNVSNSIIVLENGAVCTLEIAATLREGTKIIEKHEIITDKGVGCDRVVDTQIPQESVYIFGDVNNCYTDTDNELFGCTEYEAAIIRNAFELAKSESMREFNINKDKHLKRVLQCSNESADTAKNINIY